MIGDDVVHSGRYLGFARNNRHQARRRVYAVAQKGPIGANREPAKIPGVTAGCYFEGAIRQTRIRNSHGRLPSARHLIFQKGHGDGRKRNRR